MLERIEDVPSKEDLDSILEEGMKRLSHQNRSEDIKELFGDYVEECDRRYRSQIRQELEKRGISYTDNEEDIIFEVGDHEYQVSSTPEDAIISAAAIHKETSYAKRSNVTNKDDLGLFSDEDNSFRVTGFSREYQNLEESFKETAEDFITEMVEAFNYD